MSAVRVNECAIFATRRGADWWALFRGHGPAERFTTITASVAGDLVEVACDDREHAELLVELMLGQGVPKTALKVVR